MRPIFPLLIAASLLAACDDDPEQAQSTGTTRPPAADDLTPPERGCTQAVAQRSGDPAPIVISSEFTAAGTPVLLQANGQEWFCIGHPDGRTEMVAPAG